jgi:cell division protein FtsN
VAAKRGKTQARRSGGGGGGGGGGMPGWAWLVIGALIALIVVFAYQRSHQTGRDGFFRPTPNPDAQPKAANDDAVVDDEATDEPSAAPKAADGGEAKKKQDFDFYTLLPGKEVPMTDAELAASEQAEKAQQVKAKTDAAAAPAATPIAPAASTEPKPLPAPVDESAAKVASTEPRPAAPAPTVSTGAPTKADASADTRYILQAGAFQASGQAEELKAKIALLGLGARVESAQIGGKTVYRVRMGPYGSAGELAEAKRKLGAGGLSAMAVRTR